MPLHDDDPPLLVRNIGLDAAPIAPINITMVNVLYYATPPKQFSPTIIGSDGKMRKEVMTLD